MSSCQTEQQEQKTEQPEQRKNVLFIVVDDLRPELNCYGEKQIHSPNIDALASDGVLFQRAYCNIPVSGASRASLLTGLRPTRDRFLHYYTWADSTAPNVTCLSQHYKNNGYYTLSRGKVFHHQEDRSESWHENWRAPTISSWRDYQSTENIRRDTSGELRGPAYEHIDVPDATYKDGKIANKALDDLEMLKDKDSPFFLALGFLKPHLPFTAPAKYWDMYDRDDINLPQTNFKPIDAPDEAMHNWGELRNYGGIPQQGPLTDSLARTLIHGYYACVSYVDAQVGKVLDKLDELGMAENTTVILFGDHGWNLREHGLWCKHCNFRTSLRSAMIVSDPDIEGGKQTDALVEYVDIYPTLCDLSGLQQPGHLAGKSFVPVMKDPNMEWKDRLVCKWFDGVSLKTDKYLYTEWSKSDTAIYERMLYNHRVDLRENKNIAEMPQNQELIEELSEELHENWGEDFNE
jgi:arylsulfatase A-like enzyme